MKPGKFEEQPMPLMVTTLWFGICNSTKAFWTAASTPKSPHPGHQSGSTLPFRSAIAACLVSARTVAIVLFSSNQDFMCGNGKSGRAAQLLLYRFHNMVRHERLPVVFSDVSVRHITSFAAQVAGELAAVVVLHDDRVTCVFQNVEDRVAVQRHKPADLKLIGRNALFGEDLASFFNHSFGRSPADQCDVGVTWT